MIARGYTLDLYCDTKFEKEKNHALHIQFGGGMRQYTGETLRECLRQAKADGWRIVVARGFAICPKCRKSRAASAGTGGEP